MSTVLRTTADCTYRLSFHRDLVNVQHLDALREFPKLDEGWYSVDDLPEWAKRKIALLNMMDATPPTTYLEGIGRRISKDIYWIDAKEMDDETIY